MVDSVETFDVELDFVGNRLTVGDVVAVAQGGKGVSDLILAEITGFTKKMVRVSYINKQNFKDTVTKRPSQVAKIAVDGFEGMPAAWIKEFLRK